MTRTRALTIGSTLLAAAILVPAAAGLSEQAPTVSTLSVVATGGGPPLAGSIGQVSVITGQINDVADNRIGTWRWKCKYLGGPGTGKKTSHFCTFTVTFGSRGSITSEGGYGYLSNAPRFTAVTGGTGAYQGVFGVMRYKNLNTPATPTTYYLLRN